MFDAVLERNLPKRPLTGSVLVALGLHAVLIPSAFLLPKRAVLPESRADAVYVTFLTSPPPAEVRAPLAALAHTAAALTTVPDPGSVRERTIKPRPIATLPMAAVVPPPAESAAHPVTLLAPPVATPPSSGGMGTAAGGGAPGNGIAAGQGSGSGGLPGGSVGGAANGAAVGSDVLPFGAGMTRPVLLSKVDPTYTREALAARVEGSMLVKCVITRAGTLRNCRVVKGLPHMDDAVLAALAKWQYSPVTYQGGPVTVDYVIPVRLVLP